ncbi:hypothetical protein Dda_9055 [Drechslerella dactyloides]|uniref:Extracellular membrane protein CFEM domain-containing protein n=1 Tax=Drechslerella dactyloides TaxID=74499 RepID=A0AAD6IPV8_DREDA|nr:hypothetical protein Dda_9055 [Drechslerella dactyloides]
MRSYASSGAIALFLLSYIPSASAQGTATLFELPEYKTGRPCMRGCLYLLTQNIGCEYVDGCICRGDLASPVTHYLSTCIMSACSSLTVDVQSGVSIFQSYCNGKAPTQEPVITPVATQQIVESTVVERQTVQVTATETSTVYTTKTVQDVSTLTKITGTVTTKVPTSVTEVVYSTFATLITDSSSLQQTLDWLGGGQDGLTKEAKVAIALGVATGAAVLAFLIALCCCLSRRTELQRWKDRVPPVGGNQGWRLHSEANERADIK